jgi:hypothetical protein
MRSFISIFAFLLILQFADGCASSANGPEDRGPEGFTGNLAALEPAEGCDDVVAALREQAIDEVEQRLSDNEQRLLSGGYWCGGGGSGGGGGLPPSSGPEDDGASDYSTTNTQVVDVDEADFVKNDNQHIYVLADGHLTIIDAWPAAEAHVVSSIPVRGEPKKLYVHEDRAVVFS